MPCRPASRTFKGENEDRVDSENALREGFGDLIPVRVVVLHCVVLCCIVLCCDVFCYSVLHYITLHYIAL